MDLKDILYEITQGDTTYLKNLVKHPLIHEVVVAASKRHKCKQDMLKSWVCDYTLRYYKFDQSEYCEERFINQMTKFLGRKARQSNGNQQDRAKR
jgi:hypothetical protein